MTLLRILNFAKLDSRWSRYSNKLFLSSRDMTQCAGGNNVALNVLLTTYWLSLGKVHTKKSPTKTMPGKKYGKRIPCLSDYI